MNISISWFFQVYSLPSKHKFSSPPPPFLKYNKRLWIEYKIYTVYITILYPFLIIIITTEYN